MVGRGDDLAQQLARDRAAYGRVQVRGAPALWFDGGEVLHVPAGGAAEVLPEPVDEVTEVDRVAGGAAVVVARRVDGRAVGVHAPVGGQGEREERGGPVGAPVRRLERAARRAVRDREPGQSRCVLPAAGGADAAGLALPWRSGGPAGAGRAEHVVSVADGAFQVADGVGVVLGECGSAGRLEVGPVADDGELLGGQFGGDDLGFGVEVPAFVGLPHA